MMLVGAWAGSQPLILKAELSGLLTHIAATEGGSLSMRMISGLRLWNWKGDLRVRGGFDLVNHFVVAV